MEFIVDAQLPYRLKIWIESTTGYACLHTKDFPRKNESSDREIIQEALNSNSIIITKDSDFIKLNAIEGTPKKILYVTTGNIHNNDLLYLFKESFHKIEYYFKNGKKIVELSRSNILVHA